VEIADSPEAIRTKLKTAFTDPQRLRRSDPGDPDVCAVYQWYQKFLPAEARSTADECRAAARGCVDCKKRLAEGVVEYFAPLREKRQHYVDHPALVDEIIESGNARARTRAVETLAGVRDLMQVG
jgi:tryptophanyl-tRNA synthetase